MANITHYIGAWPAGSNPSDADVENGTGAAAHKSVIDASDAVIAELLTGLSPETSYDLEWLAKDVAADTVRGVAVNFSTPVDMGVPWPCPRLLAVPAARGLSNVSPGLELSNTSPTRTLSGVC